MLTHLMKAYGDEILRFCTSMLPDPAAAEDARQTVFVDAYQSLDRWAGTGNLRAWLYGIARHRCLDAAKVGRRWRMRFGADPQAAAQAVDAAADAGDDLDQRQRAGILRGCLRLLPAGIRVLVLLRYEEGLPYPEIARMSGEQPATIQARVARALPQLRECVERKGLTL